MGRISDLSTRENPKVPKNAFLATFWKWSKFTGSTLWGPKWRFFEVRSSAVCCPFELKIFLGLCLALKSSQKNFQLKRTAHGGAGASAKSPKSTFSKILKNRQKAKSGQKVAIFWPKTKNFKGVSQSAHFDHFCAFWATFKIFDLFRPKIGTFYDFFDLNWEIYLVVHPG